MTGTAGVLGTGGTGCVVGVIGLGAMGRPMSDHLLAAGREVIGYDVAEPARAAHAAAGGRVGGSVAEVATAADLVITSLPAAPILMEVLAELGAAAERRDSPLTVVETSTLTVAEKEAARDAAASHGVVLVDAPVSGTSAQAHRRDLVVYVSADDPALVDRARALMEDVGRATYDVGGFGNGTRTKLVANALVAIHNLAAAEALLLAERCGLDLEPTLAALADGAGTSRMLEVRGPLMTAGSYDQATMRVETFRKDLRAIRALADEVSAPMPLLSNTTVYYDAAASQGRAQQDTACVFEVLRGMSADMAPGLS